jgi:hypothetical protein
MAKLRESLREVEAMSSVALLDLLRVPMTTANARRLAANMRALGFIPLKSRRLMPGGIRDTTARGWARPVRAEGRKASNGYPTPEAHPAMTLANQGDERVARSKGNTRP